MCFPGILFGDFTTWAHVGDACAFSGAAEIVVRGRAISIIAIDISSIMPEPHVGGAVVHSAEALNGSTCLLIVLDRTFGVSTPDH